MNSFKSQLFALVSGLILVFIIIIFLIFRGIEETRQDLININYNYLAQITLKLDLTLWEDTFTSILEKNYFAEQGRTKKIGFLNFYFLKLLEGEFTDFPVNYGYYDSNLNSIVGCPPPIGPPLPEEKTYDNNTATWTTHETKLKKEALIKHSETAMDENQDIFISNKLGSKYFLFYIHPLERNDKIIGTSWAIMEFRDFYEPFRSNLEISLIFIVIVILAALAVGNNLRKGVLYIRAGLKRLNYDLSYRFSPGRGEIGEITYTINEMASTLNKVKSYTELILEGTSEGVIVLDNTGKVVYFNGAATKLLNIPREKLTGRDYREIFPKESDLIRGAIEDSIEGKDRNILKTVYRLPEGKEIPIALSTFSLGIEEKKGVVIILRDLSETERMERKLRQSDKLAALGKLVAGVAHEIKNPIAAIRANVQLWEKRIDKTKPTKEALNMVIDEVDRLNEIVNKWLIFAREKASSRTECMINDIIEKTIELMKVEIENKKGHLKSEPGENLPSLYINTQEIGQVIINLIKNALDMLTEEGTIIIRSSFDEKKQAVKVEVTDSGPGIPLELQDKIFDPFFTTKDNGTGLGLAICYDIIKNHGGTIDLETIMGKGTTFYFTLPLKEEKSEESTVSGEQ